MKDYIEITKHLCKDKPNINNLEIISNNFKTGNSYYNIKGVTKMTVIHNEENNLLKIKGSIPYFVNGQNFYTTNEDYINGFDYLENILNVKLTDAFIENFEFGKIVEVKDKANLIIQNHFSPSGMKTLNFPNGRYFENSNYLLKLYNAKENIFRKLDTMKQKELETMGFNRNNEYVKFEVKYKKPYLTFNSGILVADLINNIFEERIEENFMYQYNSIMKRKSVVIPSNKKDLSAGSIILLSLEEAALNEGKTAKELIYSMLKQIPNEVLNKEDKKARQKQFRKMLEIIEANPGSRFDLSELLQKTMNN